MAVTWKFQIGVSNEKTGHIRVRGTRTDDGVSPLVPWTATIKDQIDPKMAVDETRLTEWAERFDKLWAEQVEKDSGLPAILKEAASALEAKMADREAH